MTNVAAIRMQQSGVQFYQAWLTANDIDTLVRFEVLNYGESGKGVRRLDQEHAERSDYRATGRVIAPWGRCIGDLRFESNGEWKRSGTTVESLTKELNLALQHPEGAAG